MTDVSREYAAALYALAAEEGEQKAVSEALKEVSACLKEQPEYKELLSSPALPAEERIKALEAAFGGRVPEVVLSFLGVLCKSRHIRQYEACAAEYQDLYRDACRIAAATAVSAVELTEEQKARLKDRLETMTGRTVELACRVDPSLLGGLTVTVDGRVIDGSLKRRLREIKEVMNHES